MKPLAPADRRLLGEAARPRKRRAQPVFMAEGERVVRDLLASDLGLRLVVGTSSFWDTPGGKSLRRVAVARGLEPRRVLPEEVERLATTETPQPVVAVADIPAWTLSGALDAARDGPRVVLVLDAVQDPGNAGTLVRTAEALGVASVVALPGTVDLWNPKVVRAAAGSLFRLPVVRGGGDPTEAVRAIRDAGLELLLADAEGDPITAPFASPTALVVGNEGAGVRTELFAPDDRRVAVRMRGRAESLNVSAAAAILIHQLCR